MAYAKKGAVQRTNITQQNMKTEQKPGVDRTSKTPLTGKQKQGYAMRGAKKALGQLGHSMTGTTKKKEGRMDKDRC